MSSKRSWVRHSVLAVLLLACVGLLSSCGGGSGGAGVVVHDPGTPTQLMGVVIDLETRAPVPSASVQVTGFNDVSDKTGPQGKFTLTIPYEALGSVGAELATFSITVIGPGQAYDAASFQVSMVPYSIMEDQQYPISKKPVEDLSDDDWRPPRVR